MAERLFQTAMMQMQPALEDRNAGVMNSQGIVIASTDLSLIGHDFSDVLEALPTNKLLPKNGRCFKRIGNRSRLFYVVFCEGEDHISRNSTNILSIALSQYKQYYDEKFDKVSFIKSLLSDNIMIGDIYPKAKSLGIQTDSKRIVYLIRTNAEDYNVAEVISMLFPNKNKDFIASVSSTDTVLVQEVKDKWTEDDFKETAETLVNAISTELMIPTKVGIGSVAGTINEISRSYKDASVALDVGKVFDAESAVASYNSLGVGRLIYQLPKKICELFLDEMFKRGSIDMLDQETIVTIQKFFENNLNVSEASRCLFVHRNTLVYRLDKIYKITGLDLRNFDDAIIFKVAMMVNQYLKSGEIDI